MKMIKIVFAFLVLVGFQACNQNQDTKKTEKVPNTKEYPLSKVDSEWEKVLEPAAFRIMVKGGTEFPYKNPYWDNHEKGTYVSAATGEPLFSSDAKFESGTGWPSFYKAIDEKAIKIVRDNSLGMVRDEVVEASTGLHLGHVFDDGPKPTGKRFCMNSYALKFVPSK